MPVHIGGSKPSHKCESYRPIALLCSFNKLFEKIIFSRIQYWIETFSVILPNKKQQGFTDSLNCITTTFILSKAILSVLELHSTICTAFLDIMWAFDTVWHA